ncbi:MAG: deoxyguanosinetriphosphate triphosphohydrolase [Spirochaetes bacterium]|nr:deoxyguanosinetriphosphate triphosphohydrolase [Spirochaetota bacterium]
MAQRRKIDREYLHDNEDHLLSPLAARSKYTRGRQYPEEPHPYRAEFQRDRERIIHCRAFRRLEYKTQVFVNHEGDHYRTRLTHTIEVAQIARSIARALRLNEDLAEGIALAHDLGHTPFGHTGETVLNGLLKEDGGFEHNRQSLRVVDMLEERYQDFPGLNLTWETREGIIKHSTSYDHPEVSDFAPGERPGLEAQIIDFADEIAYNNHDLDDGLSSGMLDREGVAGLALWRHAMKAAGMADMPRGSGKLAVSRIIRTIINLLVTDLIATTEQSVVRLGLSSYDEVRRCVEKPVGFSGEIAAMSDELKRHLMKNLYRHYRVVRMGIKAERVIEELFGIYCEHPDALPDAYRSRIGSDGLKRTIADYIAGMTDRYAMEEHQKLTDPMMRV